MLTVGLAGLAVSGAVYWALSVREYHLIEAQFRLDAEQRAGSVQRQFLDDLDVVRALMAFYRGSQEVDRVEFRAFSQTFFRSHRGIHALGWAPLVAQADRKQFEQRMQASLKGRFQIAPVASREGNKTPSKAQADCFPVVFIDPPQAGTMSPGLDLGSDPSFWAAIERARQTGELSASSRFRFGTAPWSFLVCAPVFRKDISAKKPLDHPDRLEGIVFGVFQIGPIMESALDQATEAGLDFQLFDESNPGKPELLYWRASRLHDDRFDAPGDLEDTKFAGTSHNITFAVAGRQWSIRCAPTRAYLSQRTTWLPGALFFCGLLITGMLIAFGAVLTVKARQVQDLVDQRTQELQVANVNLEREIAERKRTEVGLRDSQSLYSSLVENLPIHVTRKDLEGRITFANRSFCALLGKKLEDIINRTDYDFYPPELAEKYRRDDARVAQTGELFECVEQNQKDGQTRYVQVMKSPVHDASGKIVGTQVIFWDVTERIVAGAQLEKAKEAAESANRAKSAFLANMSHEIRTPLNAILGLTELVLDTRLASEQRQYLTLVRESAESLLALVNDILDFSKIEAGKLAIDSAQFDLHELLGDTLRAMAVRAHHKGLELACRIRQGVPIAVIGDPTRLRQIIVNLVGNAIKFTERGEVVVEVDCRSRWNDEVLLHFGVTDTGIGISEEKRTLIFDAFEQADTTMTRRFGGTGLGLAISARLVELLRGRIWLESEVGRGSSFHFTTTLHQAPGEPMETGVSTASMVGLQVLAIDDNATSRTILDEMLRSWGMRPVLAANAREGIQILRQSQKTPEPIRLALVDANMPSQNGFDLVEHFRHEAGLSTKIIMMLTSGDRPGDISRCEQLRVAAYVLKPIKQSELFDAIALAMGIAVADEEDHPALATNRRIHTRSLRLLLAEDSLVNQKLVTALLERQGHKVVLANTGREAVAAVQNNRFDMVFMDIQMPEMDGLEATARIRAAEKDSGTHIPIVAMTAHAMTGDRERCLQAGMDDYLAKPIRAKRLLEVIEALVGGVAQPLTLPSSVASEARSQTACDWSAALNSVKGDRALLTMVAETFLEEAPQLLAAMRQALDRKETAELRRLAHTLKGSVDYFGASRLFDRAYQLEKIAQDGKLEEAESVFLTLAHELEQFIAVLRRDLRGSEDTGQR